MYIQKHGPFSPALEGEGFMDRHRLHATASPCSFIRVAPQATASRLPTHLLGAYRPLFRNAITEFRSTLLESLFGARGLGRGLTSREHH